MLSRAPLWSQFKVKSTTNLKRWSQFKVKFKVKAKNKLFTASAEASAEGSPIKKRFLLSFDLGYFKFHKAVYFKFHKEPATP